MFETPNLTSKPESRIDHAAHRSVVWRLGADGGDPQSSNARLAAEQGDALAQNNLGFMYYGGQGVPQDDVLAYMWANLAAAQGHAGAKNGRDIVAKRMTSEQIAEAQRLAREWKPK